MRYLIALLCIVLVGAINTTDNTPCIPSNSVKTSTFFDNMDATIVFGNSNTFCFGSTVPSVFTSNITVCGKTCLYNNYTNWFFMTNPFTEFTIGNFCCCHRQFAFISS